MFEEFFNITLQDLAIQFSDLLSDGRGLRILELQLFASFRDNMAEFNPAPQVHNRWLDEIQDEIESFILENSDEFIPEEIERLEDISRFLNNQRIR